MRHTNFSSVFCGKNRSSDHGHMTRPNNSKKKQNKYNLVNSGLCRPSRPQSENEIKNEKRDNT